MRISDWSSDVCFPILCIADRIVRIDGVTVAAARVADRAGRPLQAWPECRRLRPGELFLLSPTNTASFDSRYFGPFEASAGLGVANQIGRAACRERVLPQLKIAGAAGRIKKKNN